MIGNESTEKLIKNKSWVNFDYGGPFLKRAKTNLKKIMSDFSR